MTNKVHLAEEIAHELMKEEEVLAVLLVGSVALGIDSEDSDVDLAVFVEGPSRPVELRFPDGVRVGIERYQAREVDGLSPVPVLGLRALRDSSRFGRGRVLASRWPELERIRACWHSAVLAPQEMREHLEVARSLLDLYRAGKELSEVDRLWILQGAATALATLALCLLPCRFQKPKWVIHDLAGAGPRDLADAVRLLYSGGEADRERAARAVRAAVDGLTEGCRLGGLEPLGFDPPNTPNTRYVYQTCLDAESLLKAGDFTGAVYTAVFSLRLMNALLQQEGPREVSDEDLAAWRERWFRSALGGAWPPRHRLDEAAATLEEIAGRIEGEYGRLYESIPLPAAGEPVAAS